MNEDSLIEAGRKARAQGDFDLAVSWYRQALEVNPDSYKAVKGLGSTLHAQLKFDAAVKVYRGAISRLEDRNEVGERLGGLYLSLGAALVELNRLEEAQAQLAKARQAGADELPLFDSQGHSHLALKEFDEALIDFKAFVRLDPDSPVGHMNIARAYRGKKQYDLAAEALRTAQALAPESHWVEVALGNLAVDVADYPSALKHYQRAGLREPHNLMVKHNIGLAHLRLEHYAAAKREFSKVLEQCPSDPQALTGLAGAEEGLGNKRQAIALFKSAIIADPSNVSHYVALSHVQVAAGQVLDAVRTALRGRKVRLSQQKR